MRKLNNNILYLGLVQAFRFLLPLVTFPYLTRVLGVSGFGYLSLSTALITYSLIFCQFGFDYTATSRVARIKSSNNKLSLYSSSVIYAKITLFFLSILILAFFLLFKSDHKLTLVVLYMSPMILGSVINPIWFFQGMEKMKELTSITLFSRIFTIPFIFFIVKNPEDIYLAALLQGLPFLITGMLSFYYMYKRIHFSKIRLKYIFIVIKSSWDVFITNLSSSIYLSFLPIIIGFLGTIESVAYFNIAQTVKNICNQCFNPIYQTIFPRVSYLVKHDFSLARITILKYLKVCVLLAFLGCGFIWLFTNEIIVIIAGSDFLNSETTVDVILFSVILGVANNFLGVQTLIPIGLKKDFKNIVLLSSLLCLLLSFPVIKLYDFLGAAWLINGVEFIIFISLLRLHYYKKVKLIL